MVTDHRVNVNITAHDDDVKGLYDRTGVEYDYGDGTTNKTGNHMYKNPGQYVVNATILLDVAEGVPGLPKDIALEHIITCTNATVAVPAN